MSLPPLVEPGPELPAQERSRYARHLLLADIGELGQRRLRAASILVVGAGGLGAPVLTYLAGAGVGRLTIVDDDLVDLGNLQRQVIHTEAFIGRPKVESAAERLALFASPVQVRAVQDRVDATTIEALLEGQDLVIDGSDNFATRYLVADACEIAGIPLVWGTLDRFRGQLAVFWSAPPAPAQGISLRDLYPSPPPPGSVPNCAEAGVVGALCGMVGSMMALEAVKLITGAGTSLLGRLVLVDALESTTRTVFVKPDPGREPVTTLSAAEDVNPACEVLAGVPAAVVSARQLATEMASATPPIALDVRGAGERSIAAIEPSLWLPLEAVAEDASNPTGVMGRASAEGRGIVVYCKSGIRSARAVALLEQAGMANVRSLDGGILAWARDVDPSLPVY